MAKKYQYRASAQVKKKRKEELQRQKTIAFFKKYKFHLAAAVLLAVCLIVAAVVISNSRYYAGSLKVKNDTLVDAGENWLVVNTGKAGKPRYNKVGEVTIPENYNNLGSLTSYTLDQNFFLVANDENAMLEQVAVMGLYNTTAKAEAEADVNNPYFAQPGTLHNVTIAGHDVQLAIGHSMEKGMDEKGNYTDEQVYYKLVYANVDTAMNSVIHVNALSASYATMEELPSDEDIIAALEPIFAGITISQ